MRLSSLAVVAALGLAATMTSTIASAQPKGAVDRREQVKKKIRAMRAYTLTEELALDEQTAGKLFPLLARYDDELDKLVAAKVDAHKRLIEAGNLTDTHAIDHAIDDALANEKGLRSVEDRRVADFRKILTPQQVAKILVVLPAIDRKIQNQLARVIRQQVNGGGGGQGPRAKRQQQMRDDFDDDDGDDDAPMNHDAPQPPTPGRGGGGGGGKTMLDISCAGAKCAPGSHVLVDGVNSGATAPAKIPTTPGAHKITYVSPGGDRFTFLVTAVAGQVTPLHKTLQ
jgi:Spy/CpxP family protein refolding chaperone